MSIAVQLEPPAGALPSVEYRWDSDTDILSARIDQPPQGSGASGSVELEGADGSWLILDVARGRLSAVEVAVWPDVHKRPTLLPPTVVEDAHAVVALRQASVGVETPVRAEADEAERVIYFRIGAGRVERTIRPGRDLLVDLDPAGLIAGLWLLNVPPFPLTSPP